jgi:tetratricopeptide (TPR) repeat protein
VLFRLHDIQGSVRALSKSLQLNLRNAEAHKVLGLDLTILGDMDRAQLELEQAAALAPDTAEIRYFLGRLYYTKNIFPLARREFEAALRLDPNYMKAYDNLGLTLEAIGELDAAVVSWKRAIELSEKQGLSAEWPNINLAAYYNRQNDAEQALAHAQKAVAANGDSAEGHFQMGRAYRSMQKYAEAAGAVQKAIEANPDNAEYHYVMSVIYRKLGKTAESQAEEAAFRRLKQKESTAGMQGMSSSRMDRRAKPAGAPPSE